MKKLFLFSKNMVVNIVLIVSLLSLLVYLTTSMNTITVWYGKYTSLNEKYLNLKNQEKNLEQQIYRYKIKVEGIKQESLDKTVLEKQVRERLGAYSRNEIVLIR